MVPASYNIIQLSQYGWKYRTFTRQLTQGFGSLDKRLSFHDLAEAHFILGGHAKQVLLALHQVTHLVCCLKRLHLKPASTWTLNQNASSLPLG